jgi:hypothetical protein
LALTAFEFLLLLVYYDLTAESHRGPANDKERLSWQKNYQ